MQESLEKHIEEAPEMFKMFKELQAQEYKTLVKKNHDYGHKNITFDLDMDNWKHKVIMQTGLFTRMFDKMSRLKQLILLGLDPSVENENIDDTLQDLSNYCKILQIVRAGKWGK